MKSSMDIIMELQKSLETQKKVINVALSSLRSVSDNNEKLDEIYKDVKYLTNLNKLNKGVDISKEVNRVLNKYNDVRGKE